MRPRLPSNERALPDPGPGFVKTLCGMLLGALLLTGCPRTVEPDAGVEPDGAVDSGYDPALGNAFTGSISFDEARMQAVVPGSLRAGPTPCDQPVLVRVTRVVDGDTFVAFRDSPPFNATVRIIGIDTPEIAHPPEPAQCYGNEARSFTELLTDQLVWLTFDNECFDRFDRLLAYVHIGAGDGDLWERQLLRRGFATVLTVGGDRTYASQFEADEAIAESEGAGLWSACR